MVQTLQRARANKTQWRSKPDYALEQQHLELAHDQIVHFQTAAILYSPCGEHWRSRGNKLTVSHGPRVAAMSSSIFSAFILMMGIGSLSSCILPPLTAGTNLFSNMSIRRCVISPHSTYLKSPIYPIASPPFSSRMPKQESTYFALLINHFAEVLFASTILTWPTEQETR